LMEMKAMKPLRTAIIGCGHFAHRHAERLASLEDVALVGTWLIHTPLYCTKVLIVESLPASVAMVSSNDTPFGR
jgi:hypothetical protein